MKLSQQARDAEVSMTFGEFEDAVKAAAQATVTVLFKNMAQQIRDAEKEGPTFRSGEEFAVFLDKMAGHAENPETWKDKA